jgi:sarcosine oxidase
MLIKRAYELWDEIEHRTGEKVLHKTGSIDAGPADSWVFKGSLQSCVQYDLPHEVLTGFEINQRFPGYQLPHDILGVYQPDGGFVLPERSIVAFTEAAHALGAEIHGREHVLGWEPMGEGVRVLTDRDEYTADSLVITAGSWNYDLIPFLRGFAVPERQVLAWLQPERPEYFVPNLFPVFNLLVPEGRYYGFPIHTVPGFKFGKYHHFEEYVNPDDYEREPTIEDEEILREFASRYFPDGAGPVMTLKACMFTNSPDKHFIIDLHPEYPQVSFAAGFSGHGYKFASVIGEIMSDLAERQETRHDISLFSIERLTGQVSKLYRDRPGRRAYPLRQKRISTRPSRIRTARPLARATLDRIHTLRPTRRLRRTTRIPLERRRDLLPRRDRLSRRAYDYLDSTDPHYWTQEDIKPFWL